MKDFLHLPYPSKNAKATNEVLFVNGASSSVGAVTVQLAIASGLDVIATASPGNFEFVKSLGVREVFDYKEKDVRDGIVEAVKRYGVFKGVYDAISTPEALKLSIEVTEKLGGGFVAATLAPPGNLPEGVKSAWCMFSPPYSYYLLIFTLLLLLGFDILTFFFCFYRFRTGYCDEGT